MSILQEIMQEQVATQQQEVASAEALRTLGKYARQFKDHPGKLGSLMMVVIDELDRAGNSVARDQLRAVVEPVFGRYEVPKNRPVSNKKRAVRQRGREAGDKPAFNTRQQARDFAADQNQHGRRQRQVQDAGRKSKGPRWSAAKTSLRDT